MTNHRAVWPKGLAPADNPLKLSPGVVSNGHLSLTGMTGSRPDGTMPDDPRLQFTQAFEKISNVLQAEGLGFDAVVEMTSYHVGIRAHFDLFAEIRSTFVQEPYPAWTAIGVAELQREGALVEVKATARLG